MNKNKYSTISQMKVLPRELRVGDVLIGFGGHIVKSVCWVEDTGMDPAGYSINLVNGQYALVARHTEVEVERALVGGQPQRRRALAPMR